jgi:hypothetical protein
MSSKMKPSRMDNPKRMATINRMFRLKMLKRSTERLTQVQPMRREPASQLTNPRPMEMLSYLATVPYVALSLVSACLISKAFYSIVYDRPNHPSTLLFKKSLAIFPSPAGMSQTKLSLDGLFSDIPAGNRIASLFLQCRLFYSENRCEACSIPVCSHHLAQHRANPGELLKCKMFFVLRYTPYIQ